MIQIDETANRILKISVRTLNDVWTLKCEQNLQGMMIPNMRGEIIFRGSRTEFAKFLIKLHAKDTKTYPASIRGMKYQEIIDGIVNNTDNEIYVWSRYWNLFKTTKIITIEDV